MKTLTGSRVAARAWLTTTAPSAAAVKPFSALPSLSTLRLIWSSFMEPMDPHKPYKQWIELQKKYGDLINIEFPGENILLVSNADLYEQIYWSPGKYPAELQFRCWLERERRMKKKDPSYEMNLIALKGEEWRTNRTPLDQMFLKVDQVNLYMPKFDAIAGDLIKLMKKGLKESADGSSLKDVEKYFFQFSVEGIGSVIYNRRLNAVSEQVPENVQEFMRVLSNMMSVASRLETSIPFYRYFDTKDFKDFNRHLTKLFEVGENFVVECDELHGKESTDRTDLVHFLRSQGQSENILQSNVVTMFIAGSDSTTHSIEWLLHNLGRNEDAQRKLREEVLNVVGTTGAVTLEKMKELKYLKACVKESLRYTPTVGGITKIPAEDILIDGYVIPKGTLVVMLTQLSNKDSRFFDDPDKFIPERWLSPEKKPNPWYHLPFGFGPRMCQGARVSELEMYVLIAHVIRNFSWKSLDDSIEPFFSIFSKPDKPLSIEWKTLSV
eukprot:TRINITY_DN10413_c0_g2_i1.p1 TRINITY_DN10413_c0_g2~~TRINITY_DN10413_c0_g2_i1.p1  ORF type:complete len:495 (-),score=138.54 TRINITY_DN10413_c0_g2_i1:96-1580(-)